MSITDNPRAHAVDDVRAKVTRLCRRDGVHVLDTDPDGAVLSVVVKGGTVVAYTYTSASGEPLEATLERGAATARQPEAAGVPVPVIEECFFCRKRGDTIICRQVPCPPV
jgi:hypothetical protein